MDEARYGATVQAGALECDFDTMLAAATVLPVIGVPIGITKLQGADSLLSIVQMPTGVPVATVAIDNARNAAVLAVRMLGINDARLRNELHAYADELAATARGQTDELGRP